MENSKLKIKEDINYNKNDKNIYIISVIIFIFLIGISNFLFVIYLFHKLKTQNKIINDLINIKIKYTKKELIKNDEINKRKNNFYNDIFNIQEIDKDMIGLKYPEIEYDKLKYDLINRKTIDILIELLNQLETKLFRKRNKCYKANYIF